MSQVKDMTALMVDCVQDLYENELLTIDKLPGILKAATSPELRDALVTHIAASQGQAHRLERIAEQLGEKAKGLKCLWADGILEDAKRDTKSVAAGPLLDTALIGAIRKLEGAEIVSYETAIGVARSLGMHDAAALLVQTRSEEVAMDTVLQRLLATGLGVSVV